MNEHVMTSVSVHCENGKSYFKSQMPFGVRAIATYWSGIRVLEAKDALGKRSE